MMGMQTEEKKEMKKEYKMPMENLAIMSWLCFHSPDGLWVFENVSLDHVII